MSLCIGVCKLESEANRICIGCGRDFSYEHEKKYGFRTGQVVFVDGGIGHKDQVGMVEYDESKPGFQFRNTVTHELVQWPDDCMHVVEAFVPMGIDA